MTKALERRNQSLLVERLEADIRRRGLRPGDRYLTAAEAAEAFGVATATIHRAMAILAEKNMVVRFRNRGTFVGPGMEEGDAGRSPIVYMLIPSEAFDSSDVPFGPMIYGVRKAMGEVNVQQCFIPSRDALAYVRDLLRTAKEVGNIGGIIAISLSREIYALLAESNIPTVIFGTPHSDQEMIPSVDVDNREAGRLLVERLIQLGHRRILMLTRALGRPGDHHFFDGVSEALTAARMPHDMLVVRTVSHELDALPSIVREVLEGPNPPSAVIARGGPEMVHAVETAVAKSASSLSRQVEVVLQVAAATTSRGTSHARIEAEKEPAEIYAIIGEMLEQIRRGGELEQRRVVVPVRLAGSGEGGATANTAATADA